MSTNAPHVAKIHVIVNKVWPLGDKTVNIYAFEINTMKVKLKIREKEIRDRVLRHGMWNIADVPMVVSKWTSILEETQQMLNQSPCGLSLSMFHT